MDQLREDVQKFYGWAQKEYAGEEIDRLLFEVQSSITNLERYINNEFRKKALGKTRMRSEQLSRAPNAALQPMARRTRRRATLPPID